MRASQFLISTRREAPVEAELVSHQLMLRSGLLQRLGSGLYTWMPMGLRVLRKVEAIVREEMNKVGALEILMPAVQPAELWEESGRWHEFGPQMLKMKDRHERDFCFGPTHEEVVTDISRRELRSYKQLPLHFYQIQTKFRDEIRPRFGVMRAREFIMKDAYSFHANATCLGTTYQYMHAAYTAIFSRLGLRFRAVAADTGSIGGSYSHEFHVLADSGEDALVFCANSDYAANLELAKAAPPSKARAAAEESLSVFDTPHQTSCEAVASLAEVDIYKTIKTIALIDQNNQCLAVLLRGDHTLNEIKVTKLLGVSSCRFATEEEIVQYFGCRPGFMGPVGLPHSVRVIADLSAAVLSDFICGANESAKHLRGVNFGRDLPEPEVADVRNVVEGDQSPDGLGVLSICRGIEVGHIFQLGKKYAEAMQCTFSDEVGQTQFAQMGCYGIGISRIVAAAIEQNNDDKGIIWPDSLAPFQLVLITLGAERSDAVRDYAELLYCELIALGIDVLLDDRPLRAGVKLTDMELLGIPHRVVIGERGLADAKLEYQARKDMLSCEINVADALNVIASRVGHGMVSTL